MRKAAAAASRSPSSRQFYNPKPVDKHQEFPWEANNLEYTRRALDVIGDAAASFISSAAPNPPAARGFVACSNYLIHNWISVSADFDGCFRTDGSLISRADAKAIQHCSVLVLTIHETPNVLCSQFWPI